MPSLAQNLTDEGLASVLATDADLEVGIGGAAFLDTHLYELAYTLLVEYLEGIGLDDAVLLVELEELGSVVTREAEGHLGEVVGSEREELGNLGNLVGHEGCAGNRPIIVPTLYITVWPVSSKTLAAVRWMTSAWF